MVRFALARVRPLMEMVICRPSSASRNLKPESDLFLADVVKSVSKTDSP